MVIDLNNYKVKDIKVLSGREKGEEVRRLTNLEEKEKEEKLIEIIVPIDLYSINSSFFLGMFGPSIRKFKEEGFRNKFRFKCDEVILKNIDDGISRALKESDVLK
ncbi:MAG: hypothetical protein FIA99_12695 [Ruminiclostridium sp.]|nr:hypothetical protein [Ruminiclostridium sp.]